MLVLVEGNRRLAALKYLKATFDGQLSLRRWTSLIDGFERPDKLFESIPYILAEKRQDVDAFLGFRHVTGIKEWKPAEKAEYIAKLIDERGMSYQDVMRAIGSKTEPVRRNYIAFRLLRQLEDIEEDDVSVSYVEERFSVLYLSLREPGIQDYLGIDVKAEPASAERPVPSDKEQNLARFVRWVFGTESHDPLFTDSRNITKFGKVLESPGGVSYLESNQRPTFELAIQKSGAVESELVDLVTEATDNVELALGRIHLQRDSPTLAQAMDRFGKGATELLRRFQPKLFKSLIKDDCE